MTSAPLPPLDWTPWAARQQALVEDALQRWMPADTPADLGAAMRYAVQGGGKRLRPLLVLAASEAVGGHPEAALRAACAVEIIHAYSLVHDDMPCMDNDVLRRGKPTVHVQFGQAQALLAGDALQALAFELLVPGEGDIPAAMQVALSRLLAQAAGVQGMAGGQAIDLASVGQPLSAEALCSMHSLKTGALLQASVLMGVSCGPYGTASLIERAAPTQRTPFTELARYGAALGLAFQVVDDILDATQDSQTLGKTAGKDAAQDKPTYVTLLGLERASRQAQVLYEEALEALRDSGLADTRALAALAQRVIERTH